MGCGKTTVGRNLAGLLGLPFIDLDDTVAARAGRSIPEIFRDDGEEAFRQLETEALVAVIAQPAAVVATGGGILTREENRTRMAAAGVSIWLHLPFETILERLGQEERRRRPLFQSAARARALYEERLPVYGQAEIKMELGAGESPETVAAAIASRIRGESCVT